MKSNDKEYDYSALLGRIKMKVGTQEKLAVLVDIHPSTLNQKLKNKSCFTQSEIKRICTVLDIPLEDIPLYFFCSATLENVS